MKTSGPITHNSDLSRRHFIRNSVVTGTGIFAVAAAGLSLKDWFNSSEPIKITEHNLNLVAHQMREAFDPDNNKADSTEELDIAIIGAGISGLTAGYFLEKSGHKKFKILEMNQSAGGNSEYFTSSAGRASWGAHNLPIIRNDDLLLKDFLVEHNIIVDHKNGLPVYNEEYLCQDPHERLLIRGRWQESLIPQSGLSEVDYREIQSFLKFTDGLKSKKGVDGKYLFSIPVDNSSTDPEYRKLDQISFKDFLIQNQWASEAVHWYANYACLDDFGTTSAQTSAWAGLHYFCSRNGKAANAEEQSVVTWPEGNGFLSECLQKKIKDFIQLNSLVKNISKKNGYFEIATNDLTNHRILTYKAKQVIYCLPRFTAPYVIENYPKSDQIKYYPWVISHMQVERKALEKNHTLAWDTVRYLASDLGYINNCHQYLTQNTDDVFITFYSVFADGSPSENRKKLAAFSPEDIKQDLLAKLSLYHPGIQAAIKTIDYRVLGHGMVSPAVNFMWSNRKKTLPAEWNGIHFAHSDMSGISIFEEAFHRGHQAFLKVSNGSFG